MNQKILCVDDEPNILQGYKRTLRKDFDIHIAEGGEQGLALLKSEGPFAVVVSDMQMPGMDGARFLSLVKDLAPDTVRIMLTGNADQQTAIVAVNEGNIFRFLNKPCSAETLALALTAGLAQYRLITAEKQLLEQTLNKSLQVLIDILSLVNTTAFSRSARLKRLAGEIAQQLGMRDIWEVEIAAMLSQIGCITVPEEALVKIAQGAPLTSKELDAYHHHPQVGHDLIAQIPRLEIAAEMIAQQNRRMSNEGEIKSPAGPATMGARILKVVLDFDNLLNSDHLPHTALREMAGRSGWYDPAILNTLKEIVDKQANEYVAVQMNVPDLKPGMVLDESLVTTRGALLLSAGQEITLSFILHLTRFVEAGIIPNEIHVRVPVNKLPLMGVAQQS